MNSQKQKIIKPRYGNSSISEIAPAILDLFKAPNKRQGLSFLKKEQGKYRQVVLLIVDAFGLDHCQKFKKDLPVISQIAKNKTISELTSVFPTTTAAAVTSIYTGLTPQEHGLIEWAVYFEEFDQVIETLPFRPVKTTGMDTMLKFGGKPSMLYSGQTIFQQLKKAGVKPVAMMKKDFYGSSYTEAVTKGSDFIGFSDLKDMMDKLRQEIVKKDGRKFISVYWGDVDNKEHHFGPYSKEHQESLFDFFGQLDKRVVKKIDLKKYADTLLLICADHGQVRVNPSKTIYLNDFPEIVKNLSLSKKNNLIPPTGSPRDVFLNVKPAKVKETIKLLKKILKGVADIYEIKKLQQSGFFGLNQPSANFYRRAGNVLILPKGNNTVWYVHVPGKLFEHKGIHGGMTSEEMLVPLAYIPLSMLSSN